MPSVAVGLQPPDVAADALRRRAGTVRTDTWRRFAAYCSRKVTKKRAVGKVRGPGLHVGIRMRVTLICLPARGLAFWLHSRSTGILVVSAEPIRGQLGRSCEFETHFDCARRNPWAGG